jgi:hypothetical protein
MSDSPTERELLQLILWRLGRIEKRLGIPEWRIGDSNPPPRSGPQEPIEPAVPPGGSKPLPRIEPPPLLEPLLEQRGASESET